MSKISITRRIKLYHFIYKTTNIKNNKYYIGKHSTNNINDGYIGSGKLLMRAIKKYGKQNFKFQILEFCNDSKNLNETEKRYITEDMVLSTNCYNIALGGQGGNLGKIVNEKIGVSMSKALTGKPKTEAHKQALRLSNLSYRPTEKTKEKIKNTITQTWKLMSEHERKAKCGKSGEKNPFYGKSHSLESLEKMRRTIGDSRKGSNNPNNKPVTIYGKTYASRKECLAVLNISKRHLYKILGGS